MIMMIVTGLNFFYYEKIFFNFNNNDHCYFFCSMERASVIYLVGLEEMLTFQRGACRCVCVCVCMHALMCMCVCMHGCVCVCEFSHVEIVWKGVLKYLFHTLHTHTHTRILHTCAHFSLLKV